MRRISDLAAAVLITAALAASASAQQEMPKPAPEMAQISERAQSLCNGCRQASGADLLHKPFQVEAHRSSLFVIRLLQPAWLVR